jgi:hypothetical protein
MNKKYIFVKDWRTKDGVILKGSDLTITHGCVYFNGGLQSHYFAALFMKLIQDEEKNGFEYLRPEKLIYNKC